MKLLFVSPKGNPQTYAVASEPFKKLFQNHLGEDIMSDDTDLTFKETVRLRRALRKAGPENKSVLRDLHALQSTARWFEHEPQLKVIVLR